MKKIFISGLDGDLGTSIKCSNLFKSFHIVTSVKKKKIKKINGITYLRNNYKNIENYFKKNKIEVVLNLATKYDLESIKTSSIIDTNIKYSLKLLELSITYKIRKFINIGTNLNKFTNRYSISKNHFIDWLYYNRNKINIINLNIDYILFNNSSKQSLTNYLLQNIKQNKKIIIDSGTQKRYFIYEDDVVRVIFYLIKNNLFSKKLTNIDLAINKAYTLKKFIHELIDTYNLVNKTNYKKSHITFNNFKKNNPRNYLNKMNFESQSIISWKPKYNLISSIKKIVKELK